MISQLNGGSHLRAGMLVPACVLRIPQMNLSNEAEKDAQSCFSSAVNDIPGPKLKILRCRNWILNLWSSLVLALLACEALNMDKIGLLKCDIEEVLGESTLLVKCKDSGQRKIIRQFACGEGEDIGRTIEKLKNFSKTVKHSYVIDIEDAFSVGNTVYLLCQYCEGGSLHALIKRARQYDDVVNETELMEWLVQITLALQHLHARGITYGQLNPKNILLASNCCKLSSTLLISREFGFSGSRLLSSVTPYTSPESFPDRNNSLKSGDAWALGCVLYELCALKKLFPKRKTDEELMRDISEGQLSTFPDIFSKEMSDMWSSLMNRDPSKRLSVDDFLEMPFVSHHRKEMEEIQKAETTGAVNWPDTTPATLADVAGMKQHQFPDEKDDDQNFQEFIDDNSCEDDENNFLTAEDIDYLLNPPDS